MRRTDIVCFSHLRWDFVFQRPNQLMTRAARDRRVFFVEEPVVDPPQAGSRPRPYLARRNRDGLVVLTPHLPEALDGADRDAVVAGLIAGLHRDEEIVAPVHWFYTPMLLPWIASVRSGAIVYDCMDELSAFLGAPPRLVELEHELLRRADVVFTGGHSLFEAKRSAHPEVYAMPSAVDIDHFARARCPQPDPADQATIGHPRIGFFGVLDERIDLPLIDEVARLRPDWALVLVGPVAKIDAASLPRRSNIHYLGQKSYDELPRYLAGWDVAMMPFALNAATRFISPTKTPEYLACGRPVVSTPIRDVVASYGKAGLARIADSPAAFVGAVDAALAEDHAARWPEIDAYLASRTWDQTWAKMSTLIDAAARSANRLDQLVDAGVASATSYAATP